MVLSMVTNSLQLYSYGLQPEAFISSNCSTAETLTTAIETVLEGLWERDLTGYSQNFEQQIQLSRRVFRLV